MQINPFSNNIYRPFLFLSLFEKNTLGKKRSHDRRRFIDDPTDQDDSLQAGGGWLKKRKGMEGKCRK